MTRVILIGNSITASILYEYLRQDDRYEVCGLAVDDVFAAGGSIAELPCVGLSQLRETFPPGAYRAIIAVGYAELNRVRESLFQRLKALGYGVETYVHRDAKIYTQHPLGEGCIVLPSAILEPHVRLGANTMVWCNATLAHHSTVAEHCWIATGCVIAGQARVMRNSFLGVNSTIVNEVTVEEFNIVGAGALISKNTKAQAVHLARSAEPFRYSADEYTKYFWGAP